MKVLSVFLFLIVLDVSIGDLAWGGTSEYHMEKDDIKIGAGYWELSRSDYLKLLRDPDAKQTFEKAFVEPGKKVPGKHGNWAPIIELCIPFPEKDMRCVLGDDEAKWGKLLVRHTSKPADPHHSNYGELEVLCEGNKGLRFPKFPPPNPGPGFKSKTWCSGSADHTAPKEHKHKDTYYFSLEWRRTKASGHLKIYWEGRHRGCGDGESCLVELISFSAFTSEYGTSLTWETESEVDNVGFRIWSAIDDGNNEGYQSISTLKELPNNKLVTVPVTSGLNEQIVAKGNEREGASYSYTDISIHKEDATFYYLLEDIDTAGLRTLHCSKIQAITIGQGPVIDLENARNFCRSQCDENVNVGVVICK